MNLETAVGSQKSAQALGAPGKIKKCLITTKVTTTFFISPCTPISYTACLRPTAVSRMTVTETHRRISASMRVQYLTHNQEIAFHADRTELNMCAAFSISCSSTSKCVTARKTRSPMAFNSTPASLNACNNSGVDRSR